MRLLLFMALLSVFIGSNSAFDASRECQISAGTEEKVNKKVELQIDALPVPNEKGNEAWIEKSFSPIEVYSRVKSLDIFRSISGEKEVIASLPYGSKVNVCGFSTQTNVSGKVYFKITNLDNVFVDASEVMDHEPESYELPVNLIMQNPELPDGCEVTSLTIALNYIGIPADKCDLADNYLPQSTTLDADPNLFYLRNPRVNGFYCFAGPIVKCVENYNSANGLDIGVIDLTGCKVSKLYDYIRDGKPVVVWGTLHWNPPWKYESGLYSNLHCMVLSGFNEDYVTIKDPIYGETTVNKATFERVWKQMGQRAVVVYNKD